MNAPVPGALRDVKLTDKYRLPEGRVFMSGNQVLVRLPIQQRLRDAAAGRNTAGYVSGYRGSPLGRYDMEMWQAQELLAENHIHFRAAVNEDLAATALWGSQYVGSFPGREVRRRVRHLVRQGSGRRPLRRRAAAREQRGHQPMGRRARDRRRRSRRQVVDDHQLLRPDLHRRRDSGALPVERAGAPRFRPARHRDEPLFRLLGRAEGGHRYRRRRRHDRGRPRPSADRRAGARARSGAGRRRLEHPPRRSAARAGRASLPSQASCGTRVHPRQQAEPDHP